MANIVLKYVTLCIMIISRCSYGYKYKNWLSDDIYNDNTQLDLNYDQIRKLLFADLQTDPLSSSADYRQDRNVGVQAREDEIDNDVLRLGFQDMSGGAGEGKQHLLPDGSIKNIKEVKSDSSLPSYCSPPNLCPKGKTAADGCMEKVSDSVEFNKRYVKRQMLDGLCTCDTEHMLAENCPQQSDSQQDKNKEDWADIDEYLDGLLSDENLVKNPFVNVGEKRESLSAKKGSRNKRSLESEALEHWLNGLSKEYIADEKLKIVAKKSPII